MLFYYNKLLAKLDLFASYTQSEEYHQTWEYTKKMIEAHAKAICPSDVSLEEARSIAWFQFESTFEEDENRSLLSLAGIVANLVNAVPFGYTRCFHECIEIAFALARGEEEEIARKQHRSHVQEQSANWRHLGTIEANIMQQMDIESDPCAMIAAQLAQLQRQPILQVVEGGKKG